MKPDLSKVPEGDHNRLVFWLGKEDADIFIDRVNYNYISIVGKIYFDELIYYCKKYPRIATLVIGSVVCLLV